MALGWVKTTVVASLMFAGLGLPAGAVTVSSLAANDPTAPNVDVPGATLLGGTRINAFTDFYNFTLVSTTPVSANASATNSNGAINPFTIALFNGLNGTGAQIGSTVSGLTNIVTATFTLAPGVYDVRITGTGPASPGATYAGSLNLSPVPLPGTALLFGSGLVGLIALRRKRKQTTEPAVV
jgi:hypothetical protein